MGHCMATRRGSEEVASVSSPMSRCGQVAPGDGPSASRGAPAVNSEDIAHSDVPAAASALAAKSEAAEVDEEANVCVVCLEEREDVQVPPHLHSAGDISKHRVCQECLMKCGHQCPICRMLISAGQFIDFVQDFVGKYERRGQNYGHPNEMAETVEQWQVFELDNSDGPTLSYVTTHLLKHSTLRSLLERASQSETGGWTRDAAAVVLRLLALLRAGLARLDEAEIRETTTLLEKVLAKVLAPFERGTQRDGNHLGALYVQALAVWQLACSSGMAIEETRALAQRTAQAVAKPYEGRFVARPPQDTARTTRDFIQQHRFLVDSASASLWSEGIDPVLKVFK